MHLRLKILWAVVATVATAIGGSHSRADARIDAELQNLRALAPGFAAWCENGNLVFKSPTSARFRISGAALCVGKPDGYVVCRSGSDPAVDRSGRNVQLCSDVEAPGA